MFDSIYDNSFKGKQLKEFRAAMSSAVYIKDIAPLKTHNATKSSIRNIFKVGTKFEAYNNNGAKCVWNDTKEPKLVMVAKINTRSCWIAGIRKNGELVNEGIRYTWAQILDFYNRGNYDQYV